MTQSIDMMVSQFYPKGEPKSGFGVRTGGMVPGAGWISVGAGYRKHLFKDAFVLDASSRVSWRRYQVTEVRAELPHLGHDRMRVGGLASWQDLSQVNYFGPGTDSVASDRSQYRLQSHDISAYGVLRINRSISVGGRLGGLAQPTLSTASGWHLRGYLDTLTRFSDPEAPGIGEPTGFLHADAAFVIDTIDYPGHPTRGGLYQVVASNYRDRNGEKYSFRRYGLDLAQFVPVIDRLWTIGVRGFLVTSHTSPGNRVPFYLQQSIGGQNILRSFTDFRFHDNDLAALTIESRWALMLHVDAALFADFGKVAADFGSLRAADVKRSIGGGVRVHIGTATLMRVDLSHGAEGWRLMAKMSEPLIFSVFKRWAWIVP